MTEPPECQNDPQGGCQQGPLGGMGAGGGFIPLPGGIPWDPNFIMDQWKFTGERPSILHGTEYAFYRKDGGFATLQQLEQLMWAGEFHGCQDDGVETLCH